MIKVEKKEGLEFQSIDIRSEIKNALQEMKIKYMTPIQAKCFEPLLNGKDLMGASKTGSGKTLAFLVPLVNKVLCAQHSPHCGTLAFILSPTRELSMQIFEVLQSLVSKTDITTTLIIGGKNKGPQARSLVKGTSIVVATPGRLADILRETEFVKYNCDTLVIDEADHMMKQGFLDDMTTIARRIPGKRQTVLFSATLGNLNSSLMKKKMLSMKKNKIDNNKLSVEDKIFKLAYLSMKESCVCVDLSYEDLPSIVPNGDAKTNGQSSTNSQLVHYIHRVKQRHKLKALSRTLIFHREEKNIVFMATNLETQFYYNMMKLGGLNCICLNGDMTQVERSNNLAQFRNTPAMTLVCTDLGARGLDIHDVNNVIQYDPPYDVDQYIHRVGRTARAGKAGRSYLILRDNDEYEFVKLLFRRKINKIFLMKNDYSNVNDQLRICAKKSPEIQEQGKAAFISFIRSYRIHQLPCFDVTKLNLAQTAKTFLLNEVPEVEIMGKKKRKQLKKAEKIKKIKEDAKRKRKSDSTGDAEETPANKKKKL